MPTCDLVPTYHGFVRAVVFLHALTTVCVFLHNFRTYLVLFGNDASRLGILHNLE